MTQENETKLVDALKEIANCLKEIKCDIHNIPLKEKLLAQLEEFLQEYKISVHYAESEKNWIFARGKLAAAQEILDFVKKKIKKEEDGSINEDPCDNCANCMDDCPNNQG